MYYIKIELLLASERAINHVHTIDGNTQLRPSI